MPGSIFSKKRLFIHATNVHRGGGRALLYPVLNNLPNATQITLFLDSRMPLPANIAPQVQIKRIKPSVFHRFMAELQLAQSVTLEDVVLCFGNQPPLFKVRGHTIVFVQNRLLIDNVSLNEFPFMMRLRLAAERLWLSKKIKHADEFVVQTPTMKRLLDEKTRGKIPVHILPFTAKGGGYSRKMASHETQKKRSFDFLYVASGEPYKNHRWLIEAWCLLAKEGRFPSLKLTVDSLHFGELCSWMEQKIAQNHLRVENAGGLSHDHTKLLYDQARALIYPSTFESFGLPLIEARQAGLPVLAPELDYVRDVLDPEQTFDPKSPVSIAQAVKRFQDVGEQPLLLRDAAGFLEKILMRTE